MKKKYFYNYEFKTKVREYNLCKISNPKIIHNYSACVFCIHNVGLLKNKKGILCDTNEVRDKYEKRYLLLETKECL